MPRHYGPTLRTVFFVRNTLPSERAHYKRTPSFAVPRDQNTSQRVVENALAGHSGPQNHYYSRLSPIPTNPRRGLSLDCSMWHADSDFGIKNRPSIKTITCLTITHTVATVSDMFQLTAWASRQCNLVGRYDTHHNLPTHLQWSSGPASAWTWSRSCRRVVEWPGHLPLPQAA